MLHKQQTWNYTRKTFLMEQIKKSEQKLRRSWERSNVIKTVFEEIILVEERKQNKKKKQERQLLVLEDVTRYLNNFVFIRSLFFVFLFFFCGTWDEFFLGCLIFIKFMVLRFCHVADHLCVKIMLVLVFSFHSIVFLSLPSPHHTSLYYFFLFFFVLGISHSNRNPLLNIYGAILNNKKKKNKK